MILPYPTTEQEREELQAIAPEVRRACAEYLENLLEQAKECQGTFELVRAFANAEQLERLEILEAAVLSAQRECRERLARLGYYAFDGLEEYYSRQTHEED
jgi:hypothetical protein